MLSVTDTTLDLLVLQLVLHGLGVGVVGLVLGVLAPVGAGAEDDVLADGGGIGSRALAILGAGAELGPVLAFGHAGADCLAVGDEANSSGGLDLLAVLVVAVLDHRRAAILVVDLLRRRKLGLCGLLEIIVVRPVVLCLGSHD
jgi:hypothetical protein